MHFWFDLLNGQEVADKDMMFSRSFQNSHGLRNRLGFIQCLPSSSLLSSYHWLFASKTINWGQQMCCDPPKRFSVLSQIKVFPYCKLRVCQFTHPRCGAGKVHSVSYFRCMEHHGTMEPFPIFVATTGSCCSRIQLVNHFKPTVDISRHHSGGWELKMDPSFLGTFEKLQSWPKNNRKPGQLWLPHAFTIWKNPSTKTPKHLQDGHSFLPKNTTVTTNPTHFPGYFSPPLFVKVPIRPVFFWGGTSSWRTRSKGVHRRLAWKNTRGFRQVAWKPGPPHLLF